MYLRKTVVPVFSKTEIAVKSLNFQGVIYMVVRHGDSENNNLTGGPSNDSLYGGQGHDTLNGKQGHDYLDGGVGNDTLIAGSGNDTLIGNGGFDELTGGSGRDSFVFTVAPGANDTRLTGYYDSEGRLVIISADGRDTITDYDSGEDELYTRPITFSGSDSGGDIDNMGFGNYTPVTGVDIIPAPTDLISIDDLIIRDIIDIRDIIFDPIGFDAPIIGSSFLSRLNIEPQVTGANIVPGNQSISISQDRLVQNLINSNDGIWAGEITATTPFQSELNLGI